MGRQNYSENGIKSNRRSVDLLHGIFYVQSLERRRHDFKHNECSISLAQYVHLDVDVLFGYCRVESENNSHILLLHDRGPICWVVNARGTKKVTSKQKSFRKGEEPHDNNNH